MTAAFPVNSSFECFLMAFPEQPLYGCSPAPERRKGSTSSVFLFSSVSTSAVKEPDAKILFRTREKTMERGCHDFL